MAQSKQPADKSRFGHWVRVIVSLLSMGFIYPHAFTENDKVDRAVADGNGKAKEH